MLTQLFSVFDAIRMYGHDEDFDPPIEAKFLPTDAPPGSAEKIEALRRRVELGQPLWHVRDRCDFRGLELGKVDLKYKASEASRMGNIKVCLRPQTGGKAFS